ncbi:MAG TPA: hypothetical protein PKV16_08375 [Caldisericia bacterium]|nr:hypothetical protein [Caldisericia bacterium]HPF49383.1 hypothetical protein [Caldisericia bacterium]HPI84459.1 hypothetical protein [Caldisericia bacterium]HPQ93780.1 hypothetical protein [Caldisericia bacterium]HRV75656.1 hypothetical protein [Caldisericia bacterium]
MGSVWYLLGMAVLGVLIGVAVVLFKRTVRGKVTGKNMEVLKALDKRWMKMSDDLKLVNDIGTDLFEKFPGATPERVEKVKELSRKFEAAWFKRRGDQEVSATGTNMMETLTTYELERLVDRIEGLLTEIFTQAE